MTDFAWLKDIEDRLKAATPGKWSVYRRDQDWGDVDFVVEDERMRAISFCQEFAIPTCKLNAEFIAHSPTDIAKLIETVKVMRECLNEFHDCLITNYCTVCECLEKCK